MGDLILWTTFWPLLIHNVKLIEWSKLGYQFVNTHIVCCENQAVEHRRSADSICPTDFIQNLWKNFLLKSQYAITMDRENLSKHDTGRADTDCFNVFISITKNVAAFKIKTPVKFIYSDTYLLKVRWRFRKILWLSQNVYTNFNLFDPDKFNMDRLYTSIASLTLFSGVGNI